MRNQTAFALCLIGGVMLLLANYTQGVATIVLVYQFVHSLPALAPLYPLIDVVLVFLWIIAWSGGLSVILGGALLTTSHVRLGKFIIAVAAGFGLISLILTIVWVFWASGWAGLLILSWLVMNTPWALGLILTIIARSAAD
ncbi:MAG: hypothetical protein ACP6KW_10290 [Candidatus Thorarchaeota archaeon]